jgi:hypothetical protein
MSVFHHDEPSVVYVHDATGVRVERREPPRGQALLDHVAEMVLERKSPRQIAARLNIPYAKAVALHDEVFALVYQHIDSSYGPDRLRVLKDQLIDKLREEIDVVDDAIERNPDDPRPYRSLSHKNAAIRLLNLMNAFNAPTASVSLDLRAYAMVRPEDQERFLHDPRVRDAQLAIEAVASEFRTDRGDVPGDVRHDRQPGPLEEGEAP